MALGRFGLNARKLRKGERTRARLMDAATVVFARDGVEGASVNEIAQMAKIANGTFYSHFRDKDEIVKEVSVGIVRHIVNTLHQANTAEPAAERISFTSRQFIELAAAQPEWGASLIRAAWSSHGMRNEANVYFRADLEKGVRNGVFKVEVDDFLVNILSSMNMRAVLARIRDGAGPDASSRVAELQLRMLGVPAAASAAIAHRPLQRLEFKC